MLKAKDWLLNPSSCPGFETYEKGPHHAHGNQIHHTEYMVVKIPKRYALVNITHRIEEVVNRSHIIDGFCYVGTMHITAGVYINDAESGLLQDISTWIEKLAPFGEYQHHRSGEDNGDAHLKSYLTNNHVLVPITNGKLDFGPWQQIFYAEFDGLRHKRLVIKATGFVG